MAQCRRNAAGPYVATQRQFRWRFPQNGAYLITVIFWTICFKFGWKVDHRMRNDVAMPPQRYGAVRMAAAPFLAAPP